jgi:hypothetical protein
LGDESEQFGLGGGLGQDRGRRLDAEPFARLLLHPNIHARRGVFANTDEGKAGLHATCLKHGYALGGLGVDLLGDGAAVNEVGHAKGNSQSSMTNE